MNHTILSPLFAILLLTVTPNTVLAATFVEKEQGELFIANPVEDDVYAFGQRVTTKETISGDVATFGQIIHIESLVQEDLYAAGQAVRLLGSVGDDAHIAGDSLDVTGSVAEDLFAAGQSVTLSRTATIGKDAYLAGGSVAIHGTIEGTVRIAGGNIVIGSDAVINGDLLTYGEKPKIEEGAVIAGKREHRAEREAPASPESNPLAGWIRSTLALFVVAFLISYLLPKTTDKAFTYVQKNRTKAVVTGLLWMFLTLPVSVLIAVTGVGLPIAVILILSAVILYIFSAGLGALFAGSYLYKKLSPNAAKELTWPAAIIGAVAYEGVQLLGPIGSLTTLILVLFMAGTTLQLLWKHKE